MTLALLILAGLWLAYSNGANDNFKGVATLYGSGTCSYRTALIWATCATLLGSLTSVLLAHGLARAFSGKGLIDGGLIDSGMLTAVGGAGAITILLATLLGMPTSTTHALTGGLVGAALVADPTGVNWHALATKFAQPLLLSPVLAVVGTALVYPLLRRLRRQMGIERESCVCLAECEPASAVLGAGGAARLVAGGPATPTLRVGGANGCTEPYQGRIVGVDAQAAVDTVHYASGAAVCFARAVNDTPKIAALLLAANVFGGGVGASVKLLAVSLAMMAGGLIQSRKVAETMSRRITELNAGQGLTANLVTAALVLGASRLGVPVSTTHVSCGAIFGIGLVGRQQRWKTISAILATWVTTLPMGLLLGAVLNTALHSG